jgi:hypothetical protein
MAYIFLIIGAFCCTLAAFWRPGSPIGPGPWYGRVHIGWLGMALYLWSIVLSQYHPMH